MQILKSDFIKFMAKVTPSGINRDSYVAMALYLSSKNLVLDEESADILGFSDEPIAGQHYPAPQLNHTEATLSYRYYLAISGINSKSTEIVDPKNLVGFMLSANCFKAK